MAKLSEEINYSSDESDFDSAENERLISIIEEFRQQRDSLKEMVSDLEEIKSHINNLFPQKLDRRYMHLFEEKMNSISNIFNTLLSVKKEIMKGLKEEFELRRKVTTSDGDLDDVLDNLEIASIANKVTKLKADVEKRKEARKPLRTKGEEHVRKV